MAWGLAMAALALLATARFIRVLDSPAFFAAFPCVMAAALVAGIAAGLVTTTACTVGFAYFFLPPILAFAIARRPDDLRLAGFARSASLIAVVSGTLRAGFRRELDLRLAAEKSADALREHQRRLAAGALALERALGEARAAKEARDALVRTLSHDLRTPLSVVAHSAELLLRAPGTADDVARRAQAIRTSAARAAAMLNDLVETAQIEAGTVRLSRRPVAVGPFVAELRARLEAALPVQRLAVDLPPALPRLDADPERLERILVNLLSNAFKYSPPDAPVRLSAEARGREVVLTVSDRGPGIPPREVERVFERFYRSDRTSHVEGIGLGLYIARLLAEAHGGRVWAENVEGGTAFHVALPVAAEAAPEPDLTARAPGRSGP